MDQKTVKATVTPADQAFMEKAKKRWMSVGKPLFSLGTLEDAIIRIAGMKRDADFTLDRRALVIMCADNGIVAEGVTQTGQEVTAIVADNFTKHAASVCLMSDVAKADLFPVDIGMAVDVDSVTVAARKVAYGTKNFLMEPAMTTAQVWQAIEIGIQMVAELKHQGYDIIATGEMGIGNTTTSSAVASVLLGQPPERMTGRGAGLKSLGLQRKIAVIKQAIARHQPDHTDAVDVLAKVGGLDLAGLTGVFLGGAIHQMPIVIDGFISSVAALCAVTIADPAKDYMLPSHVSNEPGGQLLLDALGFDAFLTCGMFLGEGSGAVALYPLLEMALNVYKKMGTFEDIAVDQYEILQ